MTGLYQLPEEHGELRTAVRALADKEPVRPSGTR